VRFIHETSRARARFVAIAASFLTLAVSTTGLADDCDSPLDFGENQRCFLRQFPCIVMYFGIDQPVDYSKALTCFEREKEWSFVVLSYLNGQGAPRDLQKAESILVEAEKWNPEAFGGDQAATLEAAIRACRQNPNKPCPQLDYCKNLAETTFDMEICDAVDQVAQEEALSRTIAAVENQLKPADRATFEQAVAEFKAYQLAEMNRLSDAVFPGTLYGLAGAGQAAFARENFLKLLAETTTPGKLEPATPAAFRRADAHLSQVYRKDLAEELNQRQQIDKEFRWIVADCEKAARESQRHWVRLRDLLAKLAASLYRDQAKGFDPAIAMKYALTKARLAELRNNTIAPTGG
jgi:uncharacterized protein YecT (DUF1311 family)